MNARRDVERVIADWLIEEAPGRAPDRILVNAGRAIDRTRQRRFAVAWREPMRLSLRGLAAAAAIGAVLVGGTIFALRGGPSGTVGGPAPAPSASPSPSPSPSPSAADVLSACDFITPDEAESIAGIVGLGALPTESGSGDETTCIYADGGLNVVLRVSYTARGGRTAFDSASAVADAEPVTDIGADAVYDPTTGKLHIVQEDALVVITSGTASENQDARRERAKQLGRLVVERM